MKKDYFLGLDMGTSSVGWAVTDAQYNLLRVKGKDLWGVRLFREAKTAEERRSFRTARRRRQRQQVRMGYLRELFADAINDIDPGFYQRLDDSKYFEEDKNIKQPFALFAEKGYTDREYYQQFPTVFHLRKELIENGEKHDVRLVYLAIANLFKHRGHFLNANLDGQGIGEVTDLCFGLRELLLQYGIDIEIEEALINALEEVLPSNKFSKSKKVEEILLRVGKSKSKDKELAELIKMVCGLQGKLSTIFVYDSFDEETKKFSISFKDGNFEEKITLVEDILSDISYEIFLQLKHIHDWGVLSNIMSGNGKTYQYLSMARVDSYEKHRKDLSILKALYKTYLPTEYADMFRIMEENNYSAYVGSVKSGREEARRGAKVKPVDFFAKLKKQLSTIPDCEEKAYVLEEIEKETFLPKQLTASNGTIPNQIHKAELIAILQNAENYLEFLKEKDETGLSVSEKIVSLFEFQIPYYVGPLFNNGTGNGWAVRKEKGKVLPWNFEQKIDTKASAEEFIGRMVNHCTYLNGQRVLPKNSLLYEKYMVLNELNNLKINGEPVSVELKQDLYDQLFKKGKKVTQKKIKDHLIKNGYFKADDEIDLAGIDGDFKNTLANYAKFAEILGCEELTHSQVKMVEDIILWSTIYGDSKKFLKEKIEESYKGTLSPEKIKRILGFKFKDWGRFSKEFLQLEGADIESGEVKTIMLRMWEENYNIMELLSGRFTYVSSIEEQTQQIEKTLSDIEYEDLDDLYISAPVRRMVWQTILLVKELYKVLGNEPSRVFIEMARDVDAEKTRKDSRKKKLVDLYKKCKEDGRKWDKEVSDRSEAEFRSKKLYLYYLQKGICMYTGKEIDLYTLMNSNELYDIDHIYPRHFIKDDSIENNLVLVCKEDNNHKSDNYPIEGDIRRKMYVWWKSLREGGFITEEKYKRLIRNTPFTEEESAAFINRQIVETRQGTKTVAELFRKSFDKTEVVYVKAGLVSDFRHKFDLLKCREINNFHHANDAYLNIVVGNTYNVKFTKDPRMFIREYRRDPKNNKYHMDKIFDYDVIRNGESAWITDSGKSDSINVVREVMRKNSPLVTRMNYEEHGGLADQTIYSAKEAEKAGGEGYLRVKSGDPILDPKKYGGFKKYTGTYFFLVEHLEKGKKVRSLEAMPLYMKSKLDTVEKIEEYCRKKLGYIQPSVRVKRIKMYSLIKVNGFYLYLTGRSGKKLLVSNGIELTLSYNYTKYIRDLLKVTASGEDEEWLPTMGITREKNLELYDILTEKYNKSIYSKRPNPVGIKLTDGREQFRNLELIKNQNYILLEIIKLSGASNTGADLSQIGGVKQTGVMTLGKKISEQTEFKVINQSITGLYESEIDLLTV